jgi:hypothetical protein
VTLTVQRDLTILHQTEREKRIARTLAELEHLLDWEKLRALTPYATPAFRDLAQAGRSVVKLDQTVGFNGGRYLSSYSLADPCDLVGQVEKLEAIHNALARGLETA